MVKSYYKERTQIKVSRGKKYIEWNLGKYWMQSFHCPFPIESRHIISPVLICDNKHRYCQPGKLTGASVFSFYWGSITQAWLTALRAKFNLQFLGPRGVTQSPTLNHTVIVCWPKVPRKTKSLLSGMTFQELRDYLPKADWQRPDLLWGKVKLFIKQFLIFLFLGFHPLFTGVYPQVKVHRRKLPL